MKQIAIIISFLFLFISNLGIAQQGSLSYSLTVKDTKRQAKVNLPIVLIETTSFERIELKTDAQGALSFVLDKGEQWMLNVGDMKNYRLLKIPKGDGTGSAIITYGVERWNRLNQRPVDRSTLNLQRIEQSIATNFIPPKTNSIIEIEVLNKDKRAWRSMDVELTCIALNKTFVAKTDGKGIARFNVPNNNTFEIDLDGEINFEYIDLGNRSVVKSLTITYEKINFKEELNADGFLEQIFVDEPKPISNRFMVTLYIIGGDGK